MYWAENEFKKRIEAIIQYLEQNTYNDGFWIQEKDTSKFWKIFDQARNEFPELVYTKDDTANIQLLMDLGAWFQRWFGIDEDAES